MNFKNQYDEDVKKKNGVFYTPEDVSNLMVKKTKLFDDGKGIWLDPCCGLGILSICLASIQDDPVDFIKNRLILNEKDPTQLKIALSNFEEKFGVIPKSYNEDFLNFEFNEDYVIMNPPYFKYKESDIYAYFIEKVCKNSKGFISINPLSYTNGKNFKRTRESILKFNSIITYHFDNIPGCLFDDASVRVSIIVAHNNSNDKKTTGLIRWKSKERDVMFKSIDNHLDYGIFTEDIFYKTPKNTKDFIHKNELLKNYVTTHSEYPIYVTNSPRYFITASTNRLNRKGQIKIFMRDVESYERALIMLNSSYLYWWWRISDSSLSLTKKTLLLLPWVNFEYNNSIIDELRTSEINNKVYKKNAGKLQENIKHSKELIKKLNLCFLPNEFIELHN
jgi:predicted RNA methylase